MDEFDGGMELPDDELMGEMTPSDLAGAESEAEGEPVAAAPSTSGRPAGGGGRQGRSAARKASVRRSARKRVVKRAAPKKAGSKKKAKKGGAKRARARGRGKKKAARRRR